MFIGEGEAVFISFFPSQMQRLLEGDIYKRAVLERGNTLTNYMPKSLLKLSF